MHGAIDNQFNILERVITKLNCLVGVQMGEIEYVISMVKCIPILAKLIVMVNLLFHYICAINKINLMKRKNIFL